MVRGKCNDGNGKEMLREGSLLSPTRFQAGLGGRVWLNGEGRLRHSSGRWHGWFSSAQVGILHTSVPPLSSVTYGEAQVTLDFSVHVMNLPWWWIATWGAW